MNDLRIVLKETPETNEKMSPFAWQQHWNFTYFCPRNEKRMSKVWKTKDGETTIQYMEDYLANIFYLAIVGTQADEIAEKLKSTFDYYTLNELLQRAQRAREKADCIEVILRLAAASPKFFDPEIFRIFKQMLSHEAVEVREATCFATTYRAWLEFKELLEGLIDSAPDPELREYARTTLKSLIKNCWQGQVFTLKS